MITTVSQLVSRGVRGTKKAIMLVLPFMIIASTLVLAVDPRPLYAAVYQDRNGNTLNDHTGFFYGGVNTATNHNGVLPAAATTLCYIVGPYSATYTSIYNNNDVDSRYLALPYDLTGTKAQFESYLKSIYNSNRCQGWARMGVAFIVHTMLGDPFNVGTTLLTDGYAGSDWDRFHQLIIANNNIQMTTNGWDGRNYIKSNPAKNSYIMTTTTSPGPSYGNPRDAYFYELGGPGDNDLMYEFRSASGYYYGIKQRCANPAGDINITFDNPPRGNLESVSCSPNAVGWVRDPDYNGSIRVRITIDGGSPITAVANILRTDPGLGGNYGYNVPLPASVLDGNTHQIVATALGVNSSGVANGVNVWAGTLQLGPCSASTYNLTPSVTHSGSAYVEPGESVTFTHRVANSGSAAAPSRDYEVMQIVIPPGGSIDKVALDSAAATGCDPRYNATGFICTISSLDTGNRGFPAGNTTVNVPAGVATITPNYPIGSQVCRIFAVDRPTQNASPANRWSVPDCITIVAKPYFNVLGGDILSGGGIRSWNLDGGTYGGGGTQLAALATGNIRNFVTGGGLSGGAATRSGSGLAFANTSASGSTYGGSYTVANATVPTISTGEAITTGDLDLSTLTNNVYTRAGDLTIHGTLPTGVQATIVLTSGNLFISHDIRYGAYGSIAAIPRLSVYVQNGNISVDPSVGEIHGIYQASGAAAGNFISCGTNAFVSVNLNSASGFDTCKNKLTVYGSVTANRLILSRTNGSLRGGAGTGQPAETFHYTPELWAVPARPSSSTTLPTYNSYVSLPPIL